MFDLPDVQSEFNIMVPIVNINGNLPTRIVIAFTTNSHSTFGLTGLD